MAVNLLSDLRDFLERRFPPLPVGGRVVTLAGQQPGLGYGASATTTAQATLPPGTAAITVLATSGFTSLTVTGRSTGFAYVNEQGASLGQTYSAIVPTDVDGEVTISITTTTGQSGVLFLSAFPTILPPLPTNIGSGVAYISASRGTGTYNFDLPTQNSYKGIVCFISVTAGTGTVTVSLMDHDPLTGIANAELTSAALANPSSTRLALYPGIAALTNFTGNMAITPNVRIQAVVATAALTFQITYYLIP